MKIPRLLIVSLIFPIRNRPLAQLCEAENKYVFNPLKNLVLNRCYVI